MVNCLIKIIAKKKKEVEITIVLFRKHACAYTGFGDPGVAIIFINGSLFRNLIK